MVKFIYAIIENNNECKTVFIVSSDLTSFFQNRADVFEDDRFNALSSFIEDKIRKEIFPNTNNMLEKSYYAFHSHYDIFDDEAFNGKSNFLSDDSHIVWGFSHQGTDEIYKQISSNQELSNITEGLMNIMERSA